MNNEKGEEGHNDTDAVQTEILKNVTRHLHVNLEDFALPFVLLLQIHAAQPLGISHQSTSDLSKYPYLKKSFSTALLCHSVTQMVPSNSTVILKSIIRKQKKRQ